MALMNGKTTCLYATIIIGLSIVGLAGSTPMAYARTADGLSLDGISAHSQNANCRVATPTLSCAAATGLNTTHANDVVVLALFSNGMSVSQIFDKARLNFTARYETVDGQLAEYYAIAPSVLVNDNTTVVFSGPWHYLTFAVTFAVAGANTNHAFDPSRSLPKSTPCSGLPASSECAVNISTKRASEFVFAITAIGDAPNCVTGFTNDWSNGWVEADYIVSAPRGSVTFSCSRINGADPVAIIADAIFPQR